MSCALKMETGVWLSLLLYKNGLYGQKNSLRALVPTMPESKRQVAVVNLYPESFSTEPLPQTYHKKRRKDIFFDSYLS